MKAPDEIKKGLEICIDGECHTKRHECPYRYDGECTMSLAEDALAYIQQLEEDRKERDILADAYQQLEAAQPKWIDVEERLPERHGQACVGLYSQHGDDKPIRSRTFLHGTHTAITAM